MRRLCLFDFDQTAVARMITERRLKIAKQRGVEPDEVTSDEIDGYDEQGVKLHLKQDKVGGVGDDFLRTTCLTGSAVSNTWDGYLSTHETDADDPSVLAHEMPYISVWDSNSRPGQGMMIDDSRIVMISERQANGGAANLEVLNF